MDGINGLYVKAWAAIENPELDSVNPHFKNRYASLKATLKAVRDACAPLGMAYQQLLEQRGEGYVLKSRVVTAGEILDLSEFPVDSPPNPQSFGSGLTYKKRQQAQADWGIVGDDDDDGEAAAGYQKPKQAPKAGSDLERARERLKTALKAYCGKRGGSPEVLWTGIVAKANSEGMASIPAYWDAEAAKFEAMP